MKKSAPAIAPTPLTGKALLSKVKKLKHMPRREMVKQCGYFTILKDGQVRMNMRDFYDALLLAKGVSVNPDLVKDSRGREATHKITVHQNGQMVIGAAYTKEMGLREGDEFTIKLGYKHIRLESTSLSAEGK
jgi:AbrB-like transcriptional regulator